MRQGKYYICGVFKKEHAGQIRDLWGIFIRGIPKPGTKEMLDNVELTTWTAGSKSLFFANKEEWIVFAGNKDLALQMAKLKSGSLAEQPAFLKRARDCKDADVFVFFEGLDLKAQALFPLPPVFPALSGSSRLSFKDGLITEETAIFLLALAALPLEEQAFKKQKIAWPDALFLLRAHVPDLANLLATGLHPALKKLLLLMPQGPFQEKDNGKREILIQIKRSGMIPTLVAAFPVQDEKAAEKALDSLASAKSSLEDRNYHVIRQMTMLAGLPISGYFRVEGGHVFASESQSTLHSYLKQLEAGTLKPPDFVDLSRGFLVIDADLSCMVKNYWDNFALLILNFLGVQPAGPLPKSAALIQHLKPAQVNLRTEKGFLKISARSSTGNPLWIWSWLRLAGSGPEKPAPAPEQK